MPETMVPEEPCFASKSVKHDVTVISGRLVIGATFSLQKVCKIDAAEGTESSVTIRLLV